MSFKATDRTKKFIKQVKLLLDKGDVKNFEEIRKDLDWDKTILSNVMNGRKNVPPDIYKKFTEVYSLVEEDWKDEQIALLKENNQFLKEQIDLFKQKLTAIEKGLLEARRDQLLIASVQQAYQSWWIDNCGPKGMSPSDIRKTIARKSVEALKSFEKEGISIG